MSHADPSSITRILASAFQQRRNAGGPWSLAAVLAMCFGATVVLYGWSLFESGRASELMRIGAGRSAWIGAGALLVVGWMMFVGNILQQNRPALARLVPHHVAQLRTALLVAWALVSLAAAAGPGFGLGAPLAWGCGAAAALALLAAALRWPVLWLGGVAACFVAGALSYRFGAAGFGQALQDEWARDHGTIAAVIATAGIVVLVQVVRTGGMRRLAAFESSVFRRGALTDAGATAVAHGAGCRTRQGAIATRPYAWWFKRVLARRASPVRTRVLLGLGPATHWTARAGDFFWTTVASAVLCAAITFLLPSEARPGVVAWWSFAAMASIVPGGLQALIRLPRTRREQALLVLLPGVPRGGALNRWLGWQLSGPYLGTLLGALALWFTGRALAEAMQPGVVQRSMGGTATAFAVASLPLVLLAWRDWARLREPTAFSMVLPALAQAALAGLAAILHAYGGIGYPAIAGTFALVALAGCAWRWQRMGAEPTALPVGRLA